MRRKNVGFSFLCGARKMEMQRKMTTVCAWWLRASLWQFVIAFLCFLCFVDLVGGVRRLASEGTKSLIPGKHPCFACGLMKPSRPPHSRLLHTHTYRDLELSEWLADY